MPAVLESKPRERLAALVAVAIIQLVLGFALVAGLRVNYVRPGEAAERLVAFVLDKPPPPLPPPPKREHHAAAAPKAALATPGSPPTPRPVPAQAPPTPVIEIKPTPSPSAGGAGVGAAFGRGSGGGTGGTGTGGGDDGGTDLEQIAGEIRSSDYPRDLRERGIGGRVGVLFTVGPTGRVTRCAVTRSSGAPELDALTCRLIVQRFVYRPSTDRYGRPIADEVDGEHDWIAR